MSLAPSRYKAGFLTIYKRHIIARPTNICIVNVCASIFLAFLLSPCPLAIAQRGAPPVANRFVNAATSVISGNVTPTPVRATPAASPGICPIYILSTTLYITCTSCAIVSGTACDIISELIFPSPKFPLDVLMCDIILPSLLQISISIV